jgi:hypothetical protein
MVIPKQLKEKDNMEYVIDNVAKTLTILGEGGSVSEIKTLMETFKGYTLLTGPKKEKKECVCNPKKGGDGICKCD